MNGKKKFNSLFVIIIILLFAVVFSFSQQKQILQKKIIAIKLPDLKARISGPQKAFPGKRLRDDIHIQIENAGTADASGFAVDLILSSDTAIPVKYAVFSSNFHEDVLLKGGREGVASLAAGDSISLTLNGTNQIPVDVPCGEYFLSVVVDSGQKIKELNENNNIAYYPIKIIPRITEVQQSFSFMIAPIREITVKGIGFGSSQGSKILKMDTHTLTILGTDAWHNDRIYCSYPYGLKHGKGYSFYITDGGVRITKKFDFLLKMVLFKSECIPYEAPAGANLQLGGMYLDSTQGPKKVMFGGVEAQVNSWNTSIIEIVIPTLAPGEYDVYIKKGSTTISNVIKYTIISAD